MERRLASLLDAVRRNEGVEVIGRKSYELADLMKRDASFVDQASNESRRHSERVGGGGNIHQRWMRRTECGVR